MDSLQWGLLVLGALVLLGVVAYNLWTMRRNHVRRGAVRMPDAGAGAMDQRRDPELFDGSEVSAGGPPSDSLHTGQDDGDDGFPDTRPVPGEEDDPIARLAQSAPPERRAALDPLIDVLAPLALEQPVSGEAVLAALPPSRRVGTKPFAIEGQRAGTLDWEMPRPGQRYTALQAGVQLANRAGALNEIEFSEFVVKTQALADHLGAAPDFPDMMQEVARARELDQFASAHDAQLSFTIRALRVAWSPGYLMQHAVQQGFMAGALPGRLVMPASVPGQAPVLVLQFETQAALADDPEQSVLRQCQLTLDVAHVPREEQAFGRLRQAAQALAQGMEGVVTDDMGQALDTGTMDRIGADLEQLYDALEARDLKAGSALARRLFS
jgi:hypothetical protein